MPVRTPHHESREQRAESREQRAESREQRAESREQRAESREQRAESREQRATSDLSLPARTIAPSALWVRADLSSRRLRPRSPCVSVRRQRPSAGERGDRQGRFGGALRRYGRFELDNPHELENHRGPLGMVRSHHGRKWARHGTGSLLQPVERGDPGGAGELGQPPDPGSVRQSVERGDPGGAGELGQPPDPGSREQ